jgi:hypothetical protein
MKPGTTVTVTIIEQSPGARFFSGKVLAVGDIAMVIEEAPGLTVTLRRDPASTKPLQWRLAGLPVSIRSDADLADFRKRLADLERRTR